jgi:hypothetical protein
MLKRYHDARDAQMFERYTERARRVLFFARYEASQLGSLSIESEHLLLGLLREGKGMTGRLFAQRNVSLYAVREEIEARVTRGEKVSTSVEIPFSKDVRKTLQLAAEEADGLRHGHIGTEHLLLGILRIEKSMAASILMNAGMQLDSVREDVVRLAGTVEESSFDVLADLPRYLPSDIVHVSINARRPRAGSSHDSRHWVMVGARLESIFARAYGTDEEHVVLPAGFDDATRYDVVLMLPGDKDAPTIDGIVQRALEAQFGLTVSRESGPAGEVVVARHPWTGAAS